MEKVLFVFLIRLNFLRPKPLEAGSQLDPARLGKHINVIPEFFNILPLTSALYFKCFLLPTVLYRIQSFCNALTLYPILRGLSAIGSALPEVEHRKPLKGDHRFRELYTTSPHGNAASTPSHTSSVERELLGRAGSTKNPENEVRLLDCTVCWHLVSFIDRSIDWLMICYLNVRRIDWLIDWMID